MCEPLETLLQLIRENEGINDKARLAKLVSETLGLTKDRSVFYCTDYAIRFSSSATRNFGNTVLSLSNLRKYDDRPFIVCLVTPARNFCLIANSTFLKKISHSSQELGDRLRGQLASTCRGNEQHFPIRYEVRRRRRGCREYSRLPKPRHSVRRISDATILKSELDKQVAKYKNEILLAALIENVNVRGRVIEYLIAGEDERLRERLIAALNSGQKGLPPFKTDNTLGDYQRRFDLYDTETDVKTKIMILNSNPKAYNLDKVLEFLADARSVFMFYFVGVDSERNVSTVLVSMFQKDLLGATILLRHWAGRNSRGVSQFEGTTINRLIEQPSAAIDETKAREFLERVIAL